MIDAVVFVDDSEAIKLSGHRAMVSETGRGNSRIGHKRAMTEDHSALLTLLADLHEMTENDRVRRITEDALQKLVDAEAAHAIGAGRYERAKDRLAHRNGTRPNCLAPCLSETLVCPGFRGLA